MNLRGDTPLHLAAANGCLGSVELLLEYGANAAAKSTSRAADTALDRALATCVRVGDPSQQLKDVVKRLRAAVRGGGAAADGSDGGSDSAGAGAATAGSSWSLWKLFGSGGSGGNSPADTPISSKSGDGVSGNGSPSLPSSGAGGGRGSGAAAAAAAAPGIAAAGSGSDRPSPFAVIDSVIKDEAKAAAAAAQRASPANGRDRSDSRSSGNSAAGGFMRRLGMPFTGLITTLGVGVGGGAPPVKQAHLGKSSEEAVYDEVAKRWVFKVRATRPATGRGRPHSRSRGQTCSTGCSLRRALIHA